MQLSLNWVSRYIDLTDLSPERIARDLTMSTAEIEAVESFGDALSSIVVGHVDECGPHPAADKLSMTRVSDGSGESYPVVCGASNVRQGQKIAFVHAGSRLPDGTKIKRSKIRGEISEGMICSERELGFSDEHEGILVLDPSAEPGTPLTEVLAVCDTVFEIDNKSITHRPDLWGHYGFARELAAIYGRDLKPALEGLELSIPSKGESLSVDIAASFGACVCYQGIVLRNVEICPAPAWMRFLLLAIGQRPHNNIVDLTNFLLYDLGQPMHAFDLSRLRAGNEHGEPEINVRFAQAGECMTTLDGVLRELIEKDLLICDGQGPVALAGVMGGDGSMVDAGTTSVFLESANFDAATIRRTSMRLGLRSESSARFEKSLDPAMAETAAKKFVALMAELSPGSRASGPMSDPASWGFAGMSVPLRCDRATRLLGVDVDEKMARGLLEPLGFVLHASLEAAGEFSVDIPSWRATKDVSIEEDLIEELGRLHGYDNIVPVAPLAPARVPVRDPELWEVRGLRNILAGDLGMLEAYNYSFLRDDLCERMGLVDLPYVLVTNAIASHMSRVRRDVMPGLLGCIDDNLRRDERVALFEIGKGYQPESVGEEKALGGKIVCLPKEVLQAVAVLADRGAKAAHPYSELRGQLEHILRRMGRSGLRTLQMENAPGWMHFGRTAAFVHGEGARATVVAYVGEVHPGICDALDLEFAKDAGGVAAFCIDLRALLAVPVAGLSYCAVPKFPEQPVDLAILAPLDLQVAQIEAALHAAGPKIVRAVSLFEVYRGKGLPAGRKSLNFTVTLGSDKRTLKSEDEEKYIQRVRLAVQELGGELRG